MRGGILADEMGMGKTLQVLKSKSSHQATQAKQAAKKQPLTSPHSPSLPSSLLQTIALMCAHKDKHRTPSDEMVEVDDGLKLRGGGTLVIVPVIALAQWRTELLKWTEPGTFSIYTYHGQQREKDVRSYRSTMWC